MDKKEKEDLDLIDLISVCWNWIKSCSRTCGAWIKIFLRFNVHYWILLGLFILIGLSFAFYRTFKAPKFEGEMFVSLCGIASNDAQMKIDYLGQGISLPFGQNERLSEMLNLPIEKVQNISQISSYLCVDLNKDGKRDEIIKSVRDTMDTVLPYELCIKVNTKGACDFSKIEKAILDYFNNDSVNKSLSQRYIDIHKEEVDFIKNEIKTIDSLRLVDFQNRSGKIMAVSTNGVQTSTISETYSEEERLMLWDRQSQIRFIIEKYKNAASILSPIKISVDKSPIQNIVRYGLLFYVIGLFIAYIHYRRKDIRQFIKEA